MKKRYFISRVLTVVFSMTMCIISCALVACDKSATALTKQVAPGPEPEPDPDPENKTDYIFINNNDNVDVVETKDSTGINDQWWPSPGEFRLELRDDVVKLFGIDLENLDNAVAYGNTNATSLKTTSASEGKNIINTSSRSFPMVNDRNLATVTAKVRKDAHHVNGEYKVGGYLVVDDIVLTRLQIEGKASTRSAEWVLTKTFNVEVGAQVTLHEENISNRAAKSGLKVNLFKKFRVERYDTVGIARIEEKSSKREATTYTDEFGEKIFVVIYTDSSKVEMKKMVPMNYNIEPQKLDPMVVENFNFSISKSGKVAWESGETKVKTTDNYTIYERKGTYSSLFSNGNDKFNTDYITKSQRCEYNDGLIKFEFGYEDIKVAEGSSSSTNVESDRDDYNKSIFTNNITASYLNMAQPVQEAKDLYMKKTSEDEITDKGWDKSSKNKWFKKDSVICEADWIEKHSINPDVISHYREAFPRTRKPLTKWRATVKNFVQTTASAEEPQISSIAESKTSKDKKATWNWMKTEGSCYATTTADETKEENGIYFLEANSISATREGETLDFGEDTWTITHDGGSLGAEKQVEDVVEVPFTLKWNYTFGGDNQNIETPGVLSKEEEKDIVEKDWDLTSKKKTFTATSVDVEVNWVEKHSLKDDVVITYKKSYPRYANVGPAWTAYVSEFTQITNDIKQNKSQSTETEKDNDAVWTAVKEVYSMSASTTLTGLAVLPQENTLTSGEYNDIKITREGKTCEFGHDDVLVNHDGGSLGTAYKVLDGDASLYTLNWNYRFGSASSQEFTSNGTLIIKSIPVPEEDKILSADWANPVETINDGTYVLDIDWVIKHSIDGEEITHYQITLPRSAKCVTNWTASVNKFYQATESYKKDRKGSSKKTQSSKDGLAQWKWDAESYSITALTALNGADSQLNEIESNESNNVSITREGKTYSWGEMAVLAPHDNGHLSKVSDNQYAYTLIMKYTFGENTREIACPGTLNKK